MNAKLQIRCVVSMPFEENSYVLWLAGGVDAIVVDPGLEPELILDVLAEEKLQVCAILNTHGHADHIAGNSAMKERYPDAPLIIGAGDAAMLTDPNLNLSGPFGMPLRSPPADQLVREGDMLELAGLRMTVREIPGHSPGHVVFLVEQKPMVVLGGDVLFAGSIGRADFPGGNLQQLLAGIRAKLFTLPDDTLVLPGHHETTTIGAEKRSNPFVAEA